MAITRQEPRARGGRTRRRPDGCGPRRPAPGWRRLGPARRPSRSGQPAVRRACQRSWSRRGNAAGPPRAGRTASAPIIGAPLDIGPPGGRVGGSQPAGRFGDAHRVMQSRAFAYASTSLDRQPAAAAERRREERAIKAIRPAMTRTPSRTQSQIRLVPEEATGAAEPVACGGGGGRRDAGPGRGGRGPARQAADRAPRSARIRRPAIRRQAGSWGGKSLRRTPDADPSASCMADADALRRRRYNRRRRAPGRLGRLASLTGGRMDERILLSDTIATGNGAAFWVRSGRSSAPWRRSRPRALSGKQRNCTTPYLERLIS